jgi:putative membrane protein
MTTKPVNPPPAFDTSTRLAFQRTRVAYDRTMMAWIRTATSLITFGFGVYKFVQLELGRNAEGRQFSTREFALLMVGAGLLALVLGTLDHWYNMRSIRKQDPSLRPSMAGVLTAVIVAVGLMALLTVLFRR